MHPFHRLHNLRMENTAAGYAMQEMKPRFDTLKGRHENGTAPRAVSAFNLFQTPVAIAAQLVATLNLNRSCKVLEPSAGLGRLLDAIRPFAWDVTAIEINADLARELYHQNRSEVRLLQRDFLTVTPADTGLFDAIAMNPPFHMRSDIKHITHALQFLKPGGRLASLCFNQPNRQVLKAQSSQWIDLGPGAFKETGTPIDTAICVIDKPV